MADPRGMSSPGPCPPGLASAAAQRRARSEARVSAAIEWLQQRGRAVSLRSIAAATKEPGAPPLAESTILRNPEAYVLYAKARSQRACRPLRRARRPAPWLDRMSKAELIDLVLALRGDVAQLECCLAKQAFAEDDDD